MRHALLVVDDDRDRARVAELLRAAGWRVHAAPDPAAAPRLARSLDLDLVVGNLGSPGDPGSPGGDGSCGDPGSPGGDGSPGDGVALLHRLRLAGCRAHVLLLAGDAGPGERAAALRAGALACLPRPVDAGLLLGFLRARRSAAAPVREEVPEGAAADPELMRQLVELYLRALPGRLAAITEGARAGDAVALASASATLAGTSAQLGHPEVAAVCAAIARDARRGVLAHDLVGRLRAVTGR